MHSYKLCKLRTASHHINGTGSSQITYLLRIIALKPLASACESSLAGGPALSDCSSRKTVTMARPQDTLLRERSSVPGEPAASCVTHTRATCVPDWASEAAEVSLWLMYPSKVCGCLCVTVGVGNLRHATVRQSNAITGL